MTQRLMHMFDGFTRTGRVSGVRRRAHEVRPQSRKGTGTPTSLVAASFVLALLATAFAGCGSAATGTPTSTASNIGSTRGPQPVPSLQLRPVLDPVSCGKGISRQAPPCYRIIRACAQPHSNPAAGEAVTLPNVPASGYGCSRLGPSQMTLSVVTKASVGKGFGGHVLFIQLSKAQTSEFNRVIATPYNRKEVAFVAWGRILTMPIIVAGGSGSVLSVVGTPVNVMHAFASNRSQP